MGAATSREHGAAARAARTQHERNEERGFEMERERSSGGSREMHNAVCSECGTETQVPFLPVEGRPIYCRNCYQARRGMEGGPSGGGSGGGGREGRGGGGYGGGGGARGGHGGGGGGGY